MTPTIVVDHEKPRLIVGSPGGSKIITIYQIIPARPWYSQDPPGRGSHQGHHPRDRTPCLSRTAGTSGYPRTTTSHMGHKCRRTAAWMPSGSMIMAQ